MDKFIVGKSYGYKVDKYSDDDKNTEKKDNIIKIVKRTKKYVYISDDDRRFIKYYEGYEYLEYPFNISAKDLIV